MTEGRAGRTSKAKPPAPASVEAGRVGRYRMTSEGHLLEVDRGFAEILGYADGSELIGVSADVICPDFRRRKFWERLERNGFCDEQDLLWERKDGEPVLLRESARRLRTSTTRPQYASTVQDATARRLREGARESERQFRRSVDQAPEAWAHVNLHGRFLRTNAVFLRLFGYASDEIEGTTIFERYRADDRPPFRQLFQATLGGSRDSFLLEGGFRRRDEEYLWIQTTATIVRDDAGNPLYLAILFKDLTERRRAEEAQSWLAALVESTDVAVIGISTGGAIASWNPAAQRMYGYGSGVLGRPFSLLVPPQQLKEVSHRMEQAIAGRGPQFDVDGLRKDGRTFPASIAMSAVRDSEDRVVGLSAFVRDMTEQRRADEERRIADQRLRELERLQELDRMKTEFINIAAHELATPLTPIRLQLEVFQALHGKELSDDQRHRLAVLERNFERLSQLIRDVLDVARMQSGRLRLDLESVDLNRLVREAIESHQERARVANVALESKTGPALVFPGDAHRLSQVVFNLLNNALKFTAPGGRVAVESLREAGQAVVRVRDSGIGLTAQQIERLFQPFVQVHDRTRVNVPGTGLGLYISRRILDQHGGRLWCESPGPGKGAVFSFSIPLRANAVPDVAAKDGATAHHGRTQATAKVPVKSAVS